MKTETLIKIRDLRNAATTLAGFHNLYDEKYKNDSRCDKKGYGFNDDERFAAFKTSIHFSSHAGYYGNSNCSTVLHVNSDLAKEYLPLALNIHQKEIFATMAKLMREEAATLTKKAQEEIETLQQMLAEAQADILPVAAE